LPVRGSFFFDLRPVHSSIARGIDCLLVTLEAGARLSARHPGGSSTDYLLVTLPQEYRPP